MPTVTLHIGAFKTGTSFIQTVLSNHKDDLAADGVLFPRETWGEQVRAIQALRGRPGYDRAEWEAMVEEVKTWPGDSALISMEFMSLFSARRVQQAVEAFAPNRVRVVFTARDLSRVLPAQWQETVQNGMTWTYGEYLAGATQRQRLADRAGKHFWNKHDAARILRTWAKWVEPQDLVIVTFPPSGSPPGLLWERFCEAAGLKADRFDASIRVNESLGATSAELMRYVTREALDSGADKETVRVLKKVLAKQVLAEHKAKEPTLVLPEEHRAWAERRSAKLIDEIKALNPTVVGDLEDLRPRFDPPSGNTTPDPSAAPAEELLATAAYGLVELSHAMAQKRNRKKN